MVEMVVSLPSCIVSNTFKVVNLYMCNCSKQIEKKVFMQFTHIFMPMNVNVRPHVPVNVLRTESF